MRKFEIKFLQVKYSPLVQHTKIAIFRGALKKCTKSTSIVSASVGGAVDEPKTNGRKRSPFFKQIIPCLYWNNTWLEHCSVGCIYSDHSVWRTID